MTKVGTDGLGTAGTRPDPSSLVPADTLTIEHADGKASIVLKKGGEIEIKADKITLQGKGVKAVLANNKMDVS